MMFGQFVSLIQNKDRKRANKLRMGKKCNKDFIESSIYATIVAFFSYSFLTVMPKGWSENGGKKYF